MLLQKELSAFYAKNGFGEVVGARPLTVQVYLGPWTHQVKYGLQSSCHGASSLSCLIVAEESLFDCWRFSEHGFDAVDCATVIFT